jgi:hypothetical protein
MVKVMEHYFFVLILFVMLLYFFNLKTINIQYEYDRKLENILKSRKDINNDYNNLRSLVNTRLTDPLEYPERRGNFPYVNEGVIINKNPRAFPGITNPEYQVYQQLGIMINNDNPDKPMVIPLFGKKKYPDRDIYKYYTSIDNYNSSVKIPIEKKQNRNDPFYTGDSITISEFNKEFKITIYDYDEPKYIPYVY